MAEVTHFTTAIASLDAYAQRLERLAAMLGTGFPLPEDLCERLSGAHDGVVPATTAARLLDGAAEARRVAANVADCLAEADVELAIIVISTGTSTIDRHMDEALGTRGNGPDALPSAQQAMQPVLDEQKRLFPTRIGGPRPTPEMIAFNTWLGQAHNPWKTQ